MPSPSLAAKRIALAPRREVGRQRVAALLDDASSIIQERGYEASTVAEIALRAGARIGSHDRFFSNQDAVADALACEDIAILDSEYDALAKRAAGASAFELADLLIDRLVTIHPRLGALPALMEARMDPVPHQLSESSSVATGCLIS